MDRCVNCGQPPEAVCSCTFACLCLACEVPHKTASPEIPHFMFPYMKADQQRPDFAAAR